MLCSVFLIICGFIITTQAAPTTPDPYAEDMRNRHQIALECIDQVKIDRKVIENAMHSANDILSDAKYKEYLACSYKKQHFQSEEGVMLYDNIYDFLARFYDRSDLKNLDGCKKIKAENDGEMAYNSMKCILNGLHEIERTR